MAQKRFATRKSALACLQTTHMDTPIETHMIKFGTSPRAKLVLGPSLSPGGAASSCLSTRKAAVFCSVSATVPTQLLSFGSCAHQQDKGSVDGSDGALRQQQQPEKQALSSLQRLPVAIKKGEQLLPYVWDGQQIAAMDEAALQDSDVTTGRLRNWFLGLQRRLHEAFLPDPRDVTQDYWEWLRWRLTQRFFSSTMQNFSFSALLMATGLGAKKAFAASAAINWLLKDGVSRIVRMTVSTSFGQTFDADLKRMRFITSLIFTVCMAGEFATPFWPQHFVALASVSSVGRAVGLSAFVATQPAFQAALATGGNLADLTSKNQAQHMVMDMFALGVSAGLTWLCRGMPRGGLLLPAVMYPICAAGDLTCIWHELKAVQLRTLNRERAEMVVERWMQRGRAPDAAEISAAERLILPSDVWRGLMPLRILPLDRLAGGDPDSLLQLLQQYDGEQYVLRVAGLVKTAGSGGGAAGASGQQPGSAADGAGIGESVGAGREGGVRRWLPSFGSDGRGGQQPEVLVSLSDQATPRDITKAILHAAYLRKAVLQYFRDHIVEPSGDRHHSHPHRHYFSAGHIDSHQHKHDNQPGRHGHAHSHSPASRQPMPRHNTDGSGLSNWFHAGNDSGDLITFDGEDSLHLPESTFQAPAEERRGFHSRGIEHQDGHTHRDSHQHHQHHPHPHHQGHGRGYGGGALPAHTASLSLSQGAGAAGGCGKDERAEPCPDGGGDCGGAGQALGDAAPGPLRVPQGPVLTSTAAGAKGACAARRSDDEPAGGILSWITCSAPPCCAPGQNHAGGRAASDHRSSESHRRLSESPHCTASALQWSRLDEATWAALIRGSHREATCNLPRLLEQAEAAGWKLKPFMLNTTERVQYVRL